MVEPVPVVVPQKTVDDPDAEPDEWRLEETLTHRGSKFAMQKPVGGKHEVDVGTGEKFLSGYISPFVAYCQVQGFPVYLPKYFSPNPTST